MVEKKLVEVQIGDRLIKVDPEENKRLLAQLGNLEETQREAEFNEVREEFVDAAVDAVNGLITEDLSEALEGQCLVIPLDGTYSVLKDTAGAVLVTNEKVSVKLRGPRKKDNEAEAEAA